MMTEADAQALADVRTLDDWIRQRRYRYYSVDNHPAASADWICSLHDPDIECEDDAPDTTAQGRGPTPDAARRAAAEWVRGQPDQVWRDETSLKP